MWDGSAVIGIVLLSLGGIGDVGGLTGPGGVGDLDVTSTVSGASNALPDKVTVPVTGTTIEPTSLRIANGGTQGGYQASESVGPRPQWVESWQAMPTTEKVSLVGALVALAVGLGAAWLRLVPVVLPLFSRIEEEQLVKHPLRSQIMGLVEAEPGITKQEMRRRLGIAWGTVTYHTQRLEAARLLVTYRGQGTTGYWRNGTANAEQREQETALKSDTTRRIAQAVASAPGIRPTELCDELALGKPTASKHLKRLAGAGLVRMETRSRARHYYPTDSMVRLVHA